MHNFDVNSIFSIRNGNDFETLALEVFHYQAENNPVYKEYISYLKQDVGSIDNIFQIPFLPVDFFKSHEVITGSKPESGCTIFHSSGTTGQVPGKHYLLEPSVYIKSFVRSFTTFYPNWKEMPILALLPGYLENKNSSLIYMVNYLIKESGQPESNFYLNNFEELNQHIVFLESTGKKYFLFGVSFALLDFLEGYQPVIRNGTIIETGGMKGRKEEMTRKELHNRFKKYTHQQAIHSEYGMTELLSQAYSKKDGIYNTPPWMKIVIRDVYDPFSNVGYEQSGGINIIDLANINSCSFIETKDIGKLHTDGSFEVLGRYDHSVVRGCNLLVTSA